MKFSLMYVSINQYLQFINSLQGVELPVKVDILEYSDLGDDVMEQMVKNAENRLLLVKGSQPKTSPRKWLALLQHKA